MISLLLAAAWWYGVWAVGTIVGAILLGAFWYIRQAIQDRDARQRIAMFMEWERLL